MTFAPPADTILTQTITVNRPQGSLVLTQKCGATAANHNGSMPTGENSNTFNQYPYPTDPTTGVAAATYPTDCAIPMGNAKLITDGTPGTGQFFKASGVLNEVTVVDTRGDTDPGWVVNAHMGDFQNADTIHHFSGSELGWAPTSHSVTGTLTSSDGTYTQTVISGPAIAPNQPAGSGLGAAVTGTTPATATGAVLASAPAGAGLGIAQLDAALTLWIPINSFHGIYTGVLTITAV